MPLYPRACTACDHRFEKFSHKAEPHAIRCPACGGETRTDMREVRIVTERRFAGSGAISRTHEFHPDEVGEARRLFEATGVRITDKGLVECPTRSAERAFKAKFSAMERAAYGEPVPRPTGKSQAMLKALRERGKAKGSTPVVRQRRARKPA